MSQPKPTAGRDTVTDKVIADLKARTAKGIQTYGRPLETFNGRNPLRDLYEELLDASQYVKQELMECEDTAAELAVDFTRISCELCEKVAGRANCDRHREGCMARNRQTAEALAALGYRKGSTPPAPRIETTCAACKDRPNCEQYGTLGECQVFYPNGIYSDERPPICQECDRWDDCQGADLTNCRLEHE